ncbi:MAG TPA: class I SAM-dependent methyltransferase [Anaeromyxobacteraceae bacterium]|nr:class I SAM-dependent methyltransferase [Anaeromyxobacteraceae bacterium]
MRFCMTTVANPGSLERASAQAAAVRHGVPFAERGPGSLAALLEENGLEAALVLGRESAALFFEGKLHTWRAGMGELRLKRLRSGERGPRKTRDSFLEAASLRRGDLVLDATLGLGMDALVAAEAVGEEGLVLGVEASPLLAAWVAEGLLRHGSSAAGRVRVACEDALSFLARLPEGSVDVVVFDPMFAEPQKEGPLFGLVRRLGDARPLYPELLRRACAVARRFVVVKDGSGGAELARLGLAPLSGPRSARRRYGRLPAKGAAL